ncbi:hypothetical protein QBC39DRAFT_402309 [Podospora conica]|nr:hypothetical protein QBC39DRAFT_402309 [Schizothecium conicum]
MAEVWYTIFDYPKAVKGNVVLAWRAIPMGTRILTEKPLLIIPPLALPSSEATTPEDTHKHRRPAGAGDVNDVITSAPHRVQIEKLIADLSPEQRQILKTLPKGRGSDLLDRVLFNHLPAGRDNCGGIFPDSSRFNHSCNNNAVRAWNPTIGAYTVHAVTDIEPGEEITLSYLPRGHYPNSRTRAKYLKKFLDFICHCWLCTMPEDDRNRMDGLLDGFARLGRLYQVDDDSTLDTAEKSRRRLAFTRQKVHLLEEMGLADSRGLIQPLTAAFWTLCSHGDFARAHVFGGRVTTLNALRFGADHPETAKAQRQWDNTAKHHEFGQLSMAWKTSLADIPHDQEGPEYEDWLWRQNMAGAAEELVSLKNNRAFFPPYSNLPNQRDLDHSYFSWKGCERQGKRRHWCFLADITGKNAAYYGKERVVLANDVDGEEVSLAVAWDFEMGGGDVFKTVAVLYAEIEWLHPQLWGIRVTDPSMFKTFDASIAELVEATEHVTQRPVSTDGVRRCDCCDMKGASLRCEGCPYFWYCNEACRVRDEADHKKHCRILGDTDLQGFMALNWDDWKEDVSFPLQRHGKIEIREEVEVRVDESLKRKRDGDEMPWGS